MIHDDGTATRSHTQTHTRVSACCAYNVDLISISSHENVVNNTLTHSPTTLMGFSLKTLFIHLSTEMNIERVCKSIRDNNTCMCDGSN